MSNEIKNSTAMTPGTQGITPTIIPNDGWDEVPDDSLRGDIHGTLMIFNSNTGKYFINKAETDVSKMQFATLGVTPRWVLWGMGKDGKSRPIETLELKPGQRFPRETELPQIPTEQWPKYGDLPQKPWRNTRYVYLVRTDAAEQFTLALSTWRGLRAVSELKTSISNMRVANPRAIGIVKLGQEPAEDKFGVKPKPKFEIIDWQIPSGDPEIVSPSPIPTVSSSGSQTPLWVDR
jgi:hypothetical protein